MAAVQPISDAAVAPSRWIRIICNVSGRDPIDHLSDLGGSGVLRWAMSADGGISSWNTLCVRLMELGEVINDWSPLKFYKSQ